MIPRTDRLEELHVVLANNPVCALLGPRQSGKTTLAHQFVLTQDPAAFIDLETAAGRVRISEPELALSPLRGVVVIDEIQLEPRLYEVLRPLADRPDTPARFLILGSASPSLIRGASESLAGRVGFVDLTGFDLTEVGVGNWRTLWLRGGLPRAFLAASNDLSLDWRRGFVRTFLQRDVPEFGIRIPTETLRRFWMMLAHFHGQLWNAAELARSMGVTERTVGRYLDVLVSTYLVRRLAPWHENLSKRQYKSPKIFLRDSGLLHALLGLGSWADLEVHPKLGASWEGFVIEMALAVARRAEPFFWRTHAGAELDLLLMHGGKRYGLEVKYSDAPRMTESLRVAIEDLRLDRAWIVYPGTTSYAVHEQVHVIPIEQLPKQLGFMA